MRWNIREWSLRYIPSEVIASITAIFSAVIFDSLFKNLIFTAIGATWGENFGYYGTIIIRDILNSKRKNNHLNTKHYTRIIRNLIFEFGPAEILDSFIVRPFTMYFFPLLIHNLLIGILLGKLSADIIFYLPTIISYELRKKHFNE